MPNPILTQTPFPFHLEAARELHLSLCKLYSSSKAALFVAQKAGLPVYQINGDQAPYLVWQDILLLAANSALTATLVATAVADFPNSPLRPFLDGLLAGNHQPAKYEPRSLDGAPAFLVGDDNVAEPEALLFHDDLSISTGRIPWLIRVLEILQTLAPSVCMLEVSTPVGLSLGSGFRIGANVLLTNWHVLCPQDTSPTKVTATFGYEEDAHGNALPGKRFACDAASVQTEKKNDWGIICTNKALPTSIPTVKLNEAAVPVLHDGAFIVQHPHGGRKRVGFTRNRITHVAGNVVQYLTDTESGSSGSPVFNEKGELICLHHAGGRPQEVAGQPPVSKNEGIRIEPILEGIQKTGIKV